MELFVQSARQLNRWSLPRPRSLQIRNCK